MQQLSNIPEAILRQNDRNAVFNGLKDWFAQASEHSNVTVEHAIPTGSPEIDEILGGGYLPGQLLEFVEPNPSRGVQSLIHQAIVELRQQQRYVALIDTANQFDPCSQDSVYLQNLLWVRTTRNKDLLSACDILIRDGNFALVMLDMRDLFTQRSFRIRANEWYRLQRVCEQSQIAFVAFTRESCIPCAQIRLQFQEPLSIALLDKPTASVLGSIQVETLKRRIVPTERIENEDSRPIRKVAT